MIFFKNDIFRDALEKNKIENKKDKTSKLISKIKVENIMKIQEKYIYVDKCSCNDIIMGDLRKIINIDSIYKIVIPIKKEEAKLNLLREIEINGLTKEIIFVEAKDIKEYFHLINAAELIINLSDEDNISSDLIMALFLYKPIICRATEVNYRWLQHYPYYYNKNLTIDSLVLDEKFKVEGRKEIIKDIYKSIDLK